MVMRGKKRKGVRYYGPFGHAYAIRETLDAHRSIEACALCHRNIDPPGFALESFDPIGGFRERYRTMAPDAKRPALKQAPFTYNWVRYRIGAEVDSTTEWIDGPGGGCFWRQVAPTFTEFLKQLHTK